MIAAIQKRKREEEKERENEKRKAEFPVSVKSFYNIINNYILTIFSKAPERESKRIRQMREDVLYEKKQAHLSYYFQWSHDDDLEEMKEEEEK